MATRMQRANARAYIRNLPEGAARFYAQRYMEYRLGKGVSPGHLPPGRPANLDPELKNKIDADLREALT